MPPLGRPGRRKQIWVPKPVPCGTPWQNRRGVSRDPLQPRFLTHGLGAVTIPSFQATPHLTSNPVRTGSLYSPAFCPLVPVLRSTSKCLSIFTMHTCTSLSSNVWSVRRWPQHLIPASLLEEFASHWPGVPTSSIDGRRISCGIRL